MKRASRVNAGEHLTHMSYFHLKVSITRRNELSFIYIRILIFKILYLFFPLILRAPGLSQSKSWLTLKECTECCHEEIIAISSRL